MKILFFDTEISGHHLEYIFHFVRYITINKKEGDFYFIVHPKFHLHSKEILKNIQKQTTITFIPITENEYKGINTKNIFINSIKAYQLLTKYAKPIEPKHVFLLSLNLFILALIIHKLKYKTSGILFAPFTRMQQNNIVDKLKYYRKYWQTKLLSRQKRIDSLFILNDEKTCEHLNKTFKTEKFKMLPDPIQEIESTNEYDIRIEYKIEEQRKLYLHFGALAERKGTIDILESIAYIENELQPKISFIIAGKPDSSIEELLKEKIAYYQKSSKVQIIYINQFIENKKMKALFDQCDFVLIPYKNVESSSGILGHSAIAKKPVIGSPNGLLGELISGYNLGYLIQNNTAESIGNKINETYNQLYVVDNNSYLRGRNSNDFCNIVFQRLTE
jgi:glycosyltransferase involved in cell wall biosynthesis